MFTSTHVAASAHPSCAGLRQSDSNPAWQRQAPQRKTQTLGDPWEWIITDAIRLKAEPSTKPDTKQGTYSKELVNDLKQKEKMLRRQASRPVSVKSELIDID